MSEEEKFYAGLAMLGYIINGDYSPLEIPILAKGMARRMMQDESDPLELKGLTIGAPKRRTTKEK